MSPKAQLWLEKQIHKSLSRNAQQILLIALQAAVQNELLARCTPSSILANLCLAVQIGLVPNTALSHCWLVPFVNTRRVGREFLRVSEAQLIVSYQGFVKLAYDAAGLVVQAQPVYQGDEFEFDLANYPPVKVHKPGLGSRTPDRLTHAWCLAKSPSGQVFGEVMTRAEVLARRDSSRSYKDRDGTLKKNSPWMTHEAEMWRKTAVRHALKLAPKANDERLERAVEADDLDAHESGTTTDLVDMSDAPEELKEGDRLAVLAEQDAVPVPPAELAKWQAELSAGRTCESSMRYRSRPAVHSLRRPFMGSSVFI